MKILPEHKVTVKQVQDAFSRYLDTSAGPILEMSVSQKRHNWGLFWMQLIQEIKKDGTK